MNTPTITRIGDRAAKHLYAVSVQIETGKSPVERRRVDVDANNRHQAARIARDHFIPLGYVVVCDVNMIA